MYYDKYRTNHTMEGPKREEAGNVGDPICQWQGKG